MDNNSSDFIVNFDEKPKLNNPVLIEGLPGIGQVGKIAAEHMVEEFKAKKFATLLSHSFPPQVLVNPNGMVESMKNEFHYVKGDRDLIILTGNTQAATTEGQYRLCEKIIDVAKEFGCSMVYTVGGFGIGRNVDEPNVYGAINNENLIKKLENQNVILERSGIGHIIGASGLLLSLSKLRDMDAVCLMGETSGFYVDPKSAKVVLEALGTHLGIKINLKNLEKKAKEVEKMTAEAAEIEKKILEEMGAIPQPEIAPDEDKMRYIG